MKLSRQVALRGALLWLLILLFGGRAVSVRAQDSHTRLLLHFENNLTGAQGQTPTQAIGVSYGTGVIGKAANFPTNNQVTYSRTNNINETEGTLEFWLKPSWNGGDGQTYVFLAFGVGGGMLFAKDGANNLRSIFNRYSVGGQSEKGVAINVGSWQANQWHHVAYTWSNASHTLQLYVDGSLQTQTQFTGTLPAIANNTFQIGADGGGSYANGFLDELKISDIVRTANEISQDYLAGVPITGLSVAPATLSLLETWTYSPALTATTSSGPLPIPSSAATWTSSNTNVATVDANGVIHAVHYGSATITATVRGFAASLALTVTAPVLPPVMETSLDPFLTTPANGYIYQMPVLIIRYLPTTDGVNVDGPVADYYGTLDSLKANIDQFNLEVKFMLEEGSKFRGYKMPNAKPSLGYRVVGMITVYENLPPDMAPNHGGGNGAYQPDYNQILTRFNAQHYVNDLGVKEVWLWGYHHGNIYPVESDMSSPTTGDISNSYRIPDDLPLYNTTYTLYNYNFTRSSNEAVHNHGHQQEAILSYVAQRQDGNADLFWHQFVGQNAAGQFTGGRTGWTHMPPNTTSDYDYYNPTFVLSDIEDWTPDNIGQKKLVNDDTWGSLTYNWPYGRVPDDIIQHQWYLYWFQSYPGLENVIPYGANTLTNWWCFTGDWDNAVQNIATEGGLYSSGAMVSGTVELEGVTPNALPQTITFVFRPTNGGASFTRTATVNPGGSFNLLGIPRGAYNLWVKGAKYLAQIAPVDTTNGNAPNVTVTLPVGDADNNNVVDIGDFGLLINVYGGVNFDPNTGYDARADFNGDGAIDISDFGLLVNNYGETGAL